MDRETLVGTLNAALQTLYAESLYIIASDAGERTLCAELACILRNEFKQHAVHVEYNRHGVDVKEVELPDGNGVLTSSRVFPDIIVHQPGHDKENILVIEVKKSTNAQPDEPDLVKLTHIKNQIGYQFAVFIRLSAGPKADAKEIRIVWI